MRFINQSIEIIDELDGEAILKKLERCGRTCYKSENLITDKSSKRFIKSIINRGHESVLEHSSITIKAITNRSVSHQIIRHRIASYSQESQRYCNYSKEKFDNEIVFIKPFYFEEDGQAYQTWESSMSEAESTYFDLLEMGANPEMARGALPNDTKTEIVITMNIRSWRHFLKVRTEKDADPNIRILANLILKEFKDRIEILFDDIKGECE